MGLSRINAAAPAGPAGNRGGYWEITGMDRRSDLLVLDLATLTAVALAELVFALTA